MQIIHIYTTKLSVEHFTESPACLEKQKQSKNDSTRNISLTKKQVVGIGLATSIQVDTATYASTTIIDFQRHPTFSTVRIESVGLYTMDQFQTKCVYVWIVIT